MHSSFITRVTLLLLLLLESLENGPREESPEKLFFPVSIIIGKLVFERCVHAYNIIGRW